MTTLTEEQITILIDSREQAPFAFPGMSTETATLRAGDYSVHGLENDVAVERKSLPDLLACIGRERERFEAELVRLRGYGSRCVVVEGAWATLEAGDYRSQVSPAAVCGTLAAWTGRYQIPFMFLGSRASAEKFTRRFLFHAARRIWEQGVVFRRSVA